MDAPAPRGGPLNPLARLDVERRGSVVVARIHGDVDLSNAYDLRSALESAAAGDMTALIVDLSQTGYLDSSGVAVLAQLARELTVRRQRLAVVAPAASAVHRVLEIVRIDELAGLHTTVDEAVAADDPPR